jgi:hypothetical protein
MPSRATETVRRIAVPTVLVTVYAGLTPGLAGKVPGSALTLALCACAAAVALVIEGGRRGARLTTPWRERLPAAVAGVVGLFLAPYLVLTHRFTNAPSGTELIFLTSACWGMICAVAAAGAMWRSGVRARAFVIPAGALAALAGSAGALGNWERPSSFSPFTRFVPEQIWMLVAGVVFLAGALLMGRALRVGGRAPYLTATTTATAVALVAWLVSGDVGMSLGQLGQNGSAIAVWALSGGAFWIAWNREATSEGLVLPVAVLFAPPLLLPAFQVLERLTGLLGPDPFVWPGVIGGTLLAFAGVVRILSWSGCRREGGPSRRALWPDLGLRVFAGITVFASAAALLLPALRADVGGRREGADIAFSWLMGGWESAAGWAALGLVLLFAAAVLDDTWFATVAALVAVPSYWLLASTPTHVWNSFVPSEIQLDYGTEYASITFTALTVWPALLAVAGATAGLAVVLTRRLLRSRSASASAPENPSGGMRTR